MNRPIPSIASWGERWTLLEKRLAYAFSLRASYQTFEHATCGRRVHLKAIAPESPCLRSTYHVFGETVTQGPNGNLQEVPEATVLSGDDWIDLSESGVGTLSGGLVLQADPRTDDRLTIAYGGKVNLNGGFQQCFPLAYAPAEQELDVEAVISGTAFISTRQECAHPKYRWLIQQQFVGCGTASARVVQGAGGALQWRFDFDFDLYSGT